MIACTTKHTFPEGHTPWNKGVTAKDNEKVRVACAKGISLYAKSEQGRQHNREALRKRVKAFWARLTDEERVEFIHQRALRIKETRGDPVACAKQRASMRRTHAERPEWAEMSRQIMKEMWQDPEYQQIMAERLERGRKTSWALDKKDARIKRMWEASNRRPTGTEQIILDVIAEYGLPYKYVGNGEFLLDGKNPDFININGEKKIIEVFGEYWHEETDEQERKDFFSQYGFKTLVLWHKDIVKSDRGVIAQRIKEFV